MDLLVEILIEVYGELMFLIIPEKNRSKKYIWISKIIAVVVFLAVIALAKALAQIRGRDFVVPEDVMEAADHALPHRLLLSPAAQAQNMSAEDVVRQLLTSIPAPRLR